MKPTLSANKIYFDYAATTPVDPHVVDAMLPYFTQDFGNPSSIHYFGQQAEFGMEKARRLMAENLHCQPAEIIFTSCATESDNLAVRGAAFAERARRNANHILISPVEHHAVSHTARQLAKIHGFEVEMLPVDEFGRVSADDVAARLRPDTAIVSVIHANNEIGTLNPISEIGAACRERGIPFHSDGVQAAAHLALDVRQLQVDYLSLGAHKFYGPKGIGVLYQRSTMPLIPQQTGGAQENARRAGTQNVPYMVAMAEAFRLAQDEVESHNARLLPLRDRLIGQILEEIPDARLTGHPQQRLSNHASFVFKGVNGNTLLMMLDIAGFACSSGSACKTGNPEPSDVLLALGLSPEWALGSLRLTMGKHTQPEHVEALMGVLPDLVRRARKLQAKS